MPTLISTVADEALWDGEGSMELSNRRLDTGFTSIVGNSSVLSEYTLEEVNESSGSYDVVATSQMRNGRWFLPNPFRKKPDLSEEDVDTKLTQRATTRTLPHLSDDRNHVDGTSLLIRQKAVVFDRPSASQALPDSLDTTDEESIQSAYQRHISRRNLVRRISSLSECGDPMLRMSTDWGDPLYVLPNEEEEVVNPIYFFPKEEIDDLVNGSSDAILQADIVFRPSPLPHGSKSTESKSSPNLRHFSPPPGRFSDRAMVSRSLPFLFNNNSLANEDTPNLMVKSNQSITTRRLGDDEWTSIQPLVAPPRGMDHKSVIASYS